MWCHTHLVMNVCDIFVFSSNKTCFRISLALNPLGWGFVVHVALVQKYTKCETVSAYLFKVFRRDTGMNTFALILFSASLFACCLTRLLPGRPHNVSARSKIWITSWMNGFESWPLQKKSPVSNASSCPWKNTHVLSRPKRLSRRLSDLKSSSTTVLTSVHDFRWLACVAGTCSSKSNCSLLSGTTSWINFLCSFIRRKSLCSEPILPWMHKGHLKQHDHLKYRKCDVPHYLYTIVFDIPNPKPPCILKLRDIVWLLSNCSTAAPGTWPWGRRQCRGLVLVLGISIRSFSGWHIFPDGDDAVLCIVLHGHQLISASLLHYMLNIPCAGQPLCCV